MEYGKYGFLCRFEREAILPPYKGSTFRGVFGIALKRVVCALRREDCGECLLRQRCLYARVFETPSVMTMPEGSRISTPPHPFVIEPPPTERREFAAHDAFQCDLILFGEINNYLPYFVFAFEQMGKIGVGKGLMSRHGKFVLEEVKKGGVALYSKRDRKLKVPKEKEELNLSNGKGVSGPDETAGRKRGMDAPPRDRADRAGRNFTIRLGLQTPLRLKFNNRIKADLPFHVLVRAMLRRASSLMNTWDAGEPDLDYKGLIRRAEDVRIVKNGLRWFDWRRYSNRQEQKMFMGGMVGSVSYEGNLQEYLPLLEFCEKVHLGKNTSFGLGKINAGREP